MAFISKNSSTGMRMFKRVQFDVRVVREKIAPGAIQFHGLRRCQGGFYGSRTHGNSHRKQGTHFLTRTDAQRICTHGNGPLDCLKK